MAIRHLTYFSHALLNTRVCANLLLGRDDLQRKNSPIHVYIRLHALSSFFPLLTELVNVLVHLETFAVVYILTGAPVKATALSPLSLSLSYKHLYIHTLLISRSKIPPGTTESSLSLDHFAWRESKHNDDEEVYFSFPLPR